MKRVLVLALVTAMTVPVLPLRAAGAPGLAAGAAQATGGIQGTANSPTGQALPNTTVQVRNLNNGQVAGTTTTNATGGFNFTGLPPGNYVVEITNGGTIIGSTASVPVTAGQTASVTVAATSAAGAAGVATSTGVSKAVIITTIAAGAGIAGAVAIAVNNDSSPSR